MDKLKIYIYLSLVVFVMALPAVLWGCGEPNKIEQVKKVCEKTKAKDIEEKIDALANRADGIKSYQTEITSIFRQPLLESQTVRKGKMYYVKDEKSSALRINFLTRQDDDEEPEEDVQHFFFDGVWLSRVNWTTKHIEKRQMVSENQAVDAIELVSQNFPLVGFSDVTKLEKDFVIEAEKSSDSNSVGSLSEKIHLIPKKNSRYYGEYEYIDFWVNKEVGLPVRIESLTSEEDIYELSFLNTRVNENIDPNVFVLSPPEDFSVEVIKLENGQK